MGPAPLDSLFASVVRAQAEGLHDRHKIKHTRFKLAGSDCVNCGLSIAIYPFPLVFFFFKSNSLPLTYPLCSLYGMRL